jgi:hypothetical protein
MSGFQLIEIGFPALPFGMFLYLLSPACQGRGAACLARDPAWVSHLRGPPPNPSPGRLWAAGVREDALREQAQRAELGGAQDWDDAGGKTAPASRPEGEREGARPAVASDPNPHSVVIFVTCWILGISWVRSQLRLGLPAQPGFPAVAPDLARQAFRRRLLAVPVHPVMATDRSHNVPVKPQLFVFAGALKGSREAAGITAMLEGIEGGAGLTGRGARAGGFARVGPAGGKASRGEFRRTA